MGPGPSSVIKMMICLHLQEQDFIILLGVRGAWLKLLNECLHILTWPCGFLTLLNASYVTAVKSQRSMADSCHVNVWQKPLQHCKVISLQLIKINEKIKKKRRQEEKGITENEMVGWYHWLDGHEFEQAPGVGDGQGSLACCSPWGCKESDMTEQLNLSHIYLSLWWCEVIAFDIIVQIFKTFGWQFLMYSMF